MRCIVLLSLALAPLSFAEEAQPKSILSFRSGDSLSGEPVSITEGQMVWSSPILKEPARFPVDKLRELRNTDPTPAPETDHVAVVELTNGDIVRGRLLTLNTDALVLDTSYAGTLTIRRAMMKTLHIDELGGIVYTGPRDLDGWFQSQKPESWSYENNSLVTQKSGVIGRELQLPDAIDISFELEWRNSLQFRTILFGADARTYSQTESIELMISQGYVHLRKRVKGSTETIGTQRVPEFNSHEKARIRLLASRKTGQFRLIVNDRIAGTWTDADVDGMPAGKALQFATQSDFLLRISRIRVRPWDGTLAQDPGTEENPKETKESEEKPSGSGQRIILRNGDVVFGDVGRVEGGKLRVTTKRGELIIPVNRMRNIELGVDPAQLEEPKRMQGDIRVWHPDGGRITFRLDSLAEGVMTGYSQTFGTASFQLNAFEKVELDYLRFHLEQP